MISVAHHISRASKGCWEIADAMERLVRWHMVWDGDRGSRVAPPAG